MKKRMMSVLLTLCMLISIISAVPITASAATSGKCGDNLTWTLDNNGTLTISGTGDMWDWNWNGSPWYDNNNLKNVVIKNGVTSIGAYAFYNCSDLTSINIPDSVTSIGGNAFSGCSDLTSINIPDSVTKIGGSAFSRCSSLTSINIPDSVTIIGNRMFRDCSSLNNIKIHNRVTIIGVGAFFNCKSLTSINIPDSVICIESGAFSYCTALINIEVDSNNRNYSSVNGTLYDKNKNVLMQYAIGKKDTSFDVPNSVITIQEQAFEGCSSLTSINIPDSVTSIGGGAFNNCRSLTSINIPDSVTKIGGSAFSRCRSLTSINIPDSVTSIGDHMFSWCSSLTSINIPDSVTSIGDNVFRSCRSLTSINIPDGVTSIGDSAFSACSSLTSINIPNGVTSIGEGAFADCIRLKDVYYSGSKEQWGKIRIDNTNNSYLTNAKIHYIFNEAGAKTAPKVTTNENYSGGDNLIEKSQIDVNNLFSNISVGTDKIKGPKISILGKDFYLFQLDGKCSLKFGDVKIQLKVDEKKNSIQILGGYDFISESVSTGTSYSERGEWTKAYNDLKSLHHALAGGTLNDKTARSKFSSVYNKLNKSQSNLFLNIKGNFAVYGELVFENGSWRMSEGGGILKASASGSIDPRIGGIFYGTFGLSVDASGNFAIKYDGPNNGMSVNAKIKIEPAVNVGVGAGSKKAQFYIEGGLKGKLPVEIAAITGSFKTGAVTNTPFKVSAKGYIYMSGKAWILGVDKEWQLGNEFVLYPRNGDISLQSLDAGSLLNEYTIDKSEFKLLPRDYGSEIALMSLSDDFDKIDLYPYSTPQLTLLPDGRKLMLWIDDDPTKADADRTSMYYSIYNPADNSWSPESIAVTNIGYNDMPQICQSGGKVYIIWACADKAFGDSVELDDMMSHMDVCYTCFDGSGFGTPEILSESGNGKCEMLCDILENNGTVTAVWAENSENDYALASGTNYIYKRVLNNGTWSEKTEAAAISGELHDVKLTQNGGIVYETSEDGKAVLYLDGEKIGESQNDNSAFKVSGNEIYYLSGTELNTYNSETGDTKTEEIGEITDITIINNGNEKIALSLLSTGFTNELYQNEYKDGKWGKWTQLTEYNRYIRDYSAMLDSDGTLTAALNLVEVKDSEKGGYGKAELKVVRDFGYSDIILNDTAYPDGEIAENKSVDVCFDITNNSRNDITDIKADITDESGNIMYSGNISCSIQPGQTQTLKAPVTIPGGFKKQTLTINVSGDFEENNTENNTAELTVGFTDIAIEGAKLVKSGDKVTLEGCVRNIGFDNAENVKLEIYDSAADGTFLDTLSLNGISIGEDKKFTFELPSAYLNTDDGKRAIYIDASTDSAELEIGNNSDRIVFADLSELKSITKVSMSYDNGILTVKSPEAFGADLIAAYYTDMGQLFTFRRIELAIAAGTNKIPLEGLEVGKDTKLMLWNNGVNPICESLSW